jgi:uncharacterized protein (DUF302 family)
MHFLSKYVSMDFADAVAAAKEALKAQKFSILAEIDMGQALRRNLAIESRPYLILSACNLPLAQRAIEADDAIGSILLCNVVVRAHGDGCAEISVVDPTCTVGTINHVEMITIAQELRSMVQKLMDDIEPIPRFHRAA